MDRLWYLANLHQSVANFEGALISDRRSTFHSRNLAYFRLKFHLTRCFTFLLFMLVFFSPSLFSLSNSQSSEIFDMDGSIAKFSRGISLKRDCEFSNSKRDFYRWNSIGSVCIEIFVFLKVGRDCDRAEVQPAWLNYKVECLISVRYNQVF